MKKNLKTRYLYLALTLILFTTTLAESPATCSIQSCKTCETITNTALVKCTDCSEGYSLKANSCISKKLNCKYFDESNKACLSCNSDQKLTEEGSCIPAELRFSKGTLMIIFFVIFFVFIGLSCKLLWSSQDTYDFLKRVKKRLKGEQNDISIEKKREIGNQFLNKLAMFMKKKGGLAKKKNSISKKESSIGSKFSRKNFQKMMKMSGVKSRRNIRRNKGKKDYENLMKKKKKTKPLTPFGQILKEFREKKEREKLEKEMEEQKNMTPLGKKMKEFQKNKKKSKFQNGSGGKQFVDFQKNNNLVLKSEHRVRGKNKDKFSSISSPKRSMYKKESSESKVTPPNDISIGRGSPDLPMQRLSKKKSTFFSAQYQQKHEPEIRVNGQLPGTAAKKKKKNGILRGRRKR